MLSSPTVTVNTDRSSFFFKLLSKQQQKKNETYPTIHAENRLTTAIPQII